MKYIKLTKNKKAKVDDDKVSILEEYHWFCGTHSYAITNIHGKKVQMHRFLLNLNDPNIIVDHKNGDTLDNRLCNLRICSRSDNSRNQKIRSDNKSGYKGVSWHISAKKWEACLHIKGKKKYLGVFACKHEAARVYNKNAKKYFGEFCNLNIIKKEL